ncbi:hypothetical protein Cob_v006100 [Colletotrichum orbiculare MAFF 240422]|uniref:Uncharacterized protein n=1 Tax=Colletotrichum orbiculare (strain 104-T / ATCC 96160 / CBS 514.97 / LARS 414 / MAFF 240422) TaxID=1213857 RepID=A0A484FT01_COLOR|nr:hypothetical protein Cob_v006100 [Colletotrichum orbiculare MAFF 240422]
MERQRQQRPPRKMTDPGESYFLTGRRTCGCLSAEAYASIYCPTNAPTPSPEPIIQPAARAMASNMAFSRCPGL